MTVPGDRFETRCVLVTGGSRGLGKAIAEGFAGVGSRVALLSRSQERLDEAVASIRHRGGTAIGVAAEVTSEDQVSRAIELVVGEFGPVDILVNNAGTNALGTLLDQPPEEWWGVVDSTLRGAYLVTRAVIGPMIDRKWGRIINIASVSGKRPSRLSTAYCTAKHALLGFTRALALEVAREGITVNAVCPGWFDTDLTHATNTRRSELAGISLEEFRRAGIEQVPQGVFMAPEEIVPSVLFLASEGARRTTGEAMNVSAGVEMS